MKYPSFLIGEKLTMEVGCLTFPRVLTRLQPCVKVYWAPGLGPYPWDIITGRAVLLGLPLSPTLSLLLRLVSWVCVRGQVVCLGLLISLLLILLLGLGWWACVPIF